MIGSVLLAKLIAVLASLNQFNCSLRPLNLLSIKFQELVSEIIGYIGSPDVYLLDHDIFPSKSGNGQLYMNLYMS